VSVKLLTVLSILATLCFLGLVTLQVLEFNEYRKPPSVWPVAAN